MSEGIVGEGASVRFTRRSVLAGASAAAAAPTAFAAESSFRGWTRAGRVETLPLHLRIDTGAGVTTLGQWLDGRPAVIALWASWCGPCLVEKPAQAAMSRRLVEHGSRTRILVLQTFDDITLQQGRDVLARLGAGDLINARATQDTERALIRLLGQSDVDETRTSMPWHLLVDSQGRELARSLGLMRGSDGRYSYFEDDATFEFLRSLA